MIAMNKFFKLTLSALIICLSVLSLTYFLNLKFQQPKEFKIKIYDSSLRSGEYYVTAVLNCALPRVPEEMQTMEVINYVFSEAEAIELAEKLFNMTPPLQLNWLDWAKSMRISREKVDLFLYHAGGFSYYAYDLWNIERPSLPNSLECKQIADAFLEKVASFGYMPESAQLEFREVSPSAEHIESTERWVLEMSVIYTLKYNGIPVADGGVSVGIGHQGKIASIKATWRNVKPGRNVQITISPEEALKNLGEYIPPTRCPPGTKKVIINKVELAYCQDSMETGEPLNELQVVYLFEALVIKEDGTQSKTHFWAPAHK